MINKKHKKVAYTNYFSKTERYAETYFAECHLRRSSKAFRYSR